MHNFRQTLGPSVVRGIIHILKVKHLLNKVFNVKCLVFIFNTETGTGFVPRLTLRQLGVLLYPLDPGVPVLLSALSTRVLLSPCQGEVLESRG